MINLKEVIEKYPECLDNKTKLKAILTDLYPTEKARIRVIVDSFECGVYEKLKSAKEIDELLIDNLCNMLENDYAISDKFAEWCINEWTNLLGKVQEDNKPCISIANTVITKDKQKEQTSTKNIESKPKATSQKRASKTNVFEIKDGVLLKYKGKDMMVVIPKSVTSIGYRAFYGCTSLVSIEIPNKVTSIGNGAFTDCTSLTSIEIPDSVQSIGGHAFSHCSKLTSVVIPDSVTSIGEYAFSHCSKLTRVVIPDSVTSIGNGAFEYCSKLTRVVIPNSVTSIGDDAFYGCSKITSVVIPNSVTSIGNKAFSCCSKLTRVVIPNSVTSIGDDAFFGCSSLTSVEIPNSVTSIGEDAFAYCSSLTSVEIPNSVTSIGEYAFSHCSKLTSITVDENNEYYKSIDGNLYSKDGKTLIQYAIGKTATEFVIPDGVESIGKYVFSDCLSLTSVEIPNSVTSIGGSAFEYCSALTSVTIPDSVTRIGYNAFYNCAKLKSINYNGTKAQWQAIKKTFIGIEITQLLKFTVLMTNY